MTHPVASYDRNDLHARIRSHAAIVNPISRREIERAVAHVFEVTIPEIERQRRGKAPVALARQVAMYLTHVGLGLTMTEVGQLFTRDRTTVAHACAQVEDRREEPSFDYAMQCLEGVVVHLVGLCSPQHMSASHTP